MTHHLQLTIPMSPRPRSTSDADILAAVLRAVGRVGTVRLTLADIATEAHLAPATLIQRFGSKRALLLATVQHGVVAVDTRFAEIRRRHRSPVAALIDAATEMAHHLPSAEALANHVAFLQLDLGDPIFHRLALEHSGRVLAGYRALIDDAIAAGELTATDTNQLARSIHALVRGSLITWAIHREGTLLTWMRDDLDALLAPYRRHDAHTPAGGASIPRPPAGPRARHKL
jgi:AcrR family transcriptional regulator